MKVSGPGKANAIVRLAAQSPVAQAQPAPAQSDPTFPSASRLAADVGMLMALAAVEGTPQSRQRALARANRGIDALDALHRARIGGENVEEILHRLQQWLESEAAPDRALAPLMKEIDTRIRVEIARHERDR